MTSFSVTSFKKGISEFQEDSVHIQLSKSRILCFRSDCLVICPDAHQCREASE